MKRLLHLGCILLLCIAQGSFGQTNTHSIKAAGNDAVLLTVAGAVEVARVGTTMWGTGQTNQILKVGDRIRTAKNSRATVRLSNLSVLRMYELTTLEIQPVEKNARSMIDVKSGSVYFFNRDLPSQTQFRTPSASGAIRGTEFNLAVAEDGRMLLTLVDGEVDLKNELGELTLVSGEQASVEPGKAPQKSPSLDAVSAIQWTLYYPGVLDPSELNLTESQKQALSQSLDSYRAGDLLKAVAHYPFDRAATSNDETVYRAALLLSVGNVAEATETLNTVTGSGKPVALANALRQLIAAVKHQDISTSAEPTGATELLAASYLEQSRTHLARALVLARQAATASPNFGFAHARVAELEFSFGNIDDASKALDKALQLSPNNAQAFALQGFLMAARNKFTQARQSFDQAISLDGSLGNAWLGRGLIRFKKGDVAGGRKDLETAAALEPNRAILRSYLGKAWSENRAFRYSWDQYLAQKELALAKKLDANDPTAWLYSALLNQQRNEVNQAIDDLEKSQDLNNNRGIFRSQLLLDQDRAVRSANLASIYRDAGMVDYSVREASRAVNSDYVNYSSHLFLSESYDALRDPRSISLRYETPWLNELLIANLLAPVGAGNLSQNISQQEYSRLFDTDRLGVSSMTEYFSSGDWYQNASQFGNIGNSAYALDVDYRSQNGFRINNDFENLYLSAKFKQQITPKDSVYLQTTYSRNESGDILQYYSQLAASPTLRVKDVQEPNLFAGYHHEWQPGSHTLFLLARLDDDFRLTNPVASGNLAFLTGPSTPPFAFGTITANQNLRSEFVAYSTEAQHIFQRSDNTFIFGGRAQWGDNDTHSILSKIPGTSKSFDQTISSDVQRYSAYAYDYYDLLDSLQLSAGVTYDHLEFPLNTDVAPITSSEKTKEQTSPKAGIRWSPMPDTVLRADYTRSLGGLFFDQSVRLEPSQIAGFNQSFRSIAPESLVGSIAGSEFTTYGVGFDQKFPTRTYLTIEANQLESDAERLLGTTTYTITGGGLPTPSIGSLPQMVQYEERTVSAALTQLISDEWSIGARYRLGYGELRNSFPTLPAAIANSTGIPGEINGTLHQVNTYLLYNLRCGFFARGEANWYLQSLRGFNGTVPGDEFFQFNIYAGYRFAQRRAEIRLGILNLAGKDYNLMPINLYNELPRERMFTAMLKFTF
jgi:cytochrome c-type biogenesis protein CcmH/NrfG